MVSHLDQISQQLSSHRAPSVSSRASSSRRHRHHRSHHGGSSHSLQNEFPIFSQTGDVEIILTPINGRKEQRYLLHGLILSQSAGFFDLETGLSSGTNAGRVAAPVVGQYGALSRIGEHDGPSPAGSATASHSSRDRSGDGRRWRFVLDWGNTGDHEVPRLVQHRATGSCPEQDPHGPPPVVRNKPPASSNAFFRSMSNLSALSLNGQPSATLDPDEETLRDYENLFRIFYNYTPALDDANIASAYTECKALLHLADMYDALDVVGPRVDHHLLRFQGRLFKQIAKYSPSYLKLGYLAHSKVIFAEALIHVVGQWPFAAPQLRDQIDPVIMDIIEDKVDELEELKLKIEAKLFRLTLTTSRGDRVTPSNSFLDWLAMSLFRQWLAENTTPAPSPILKDPSHPSSNGTLISCGVQSSRDHRPAGHPRSSSRAARNETSTPPVIAPVTSSARVFRLLGSTSPTAYLPHDELKRFLKHSPPEGGFYTRDNLRRFERRIDELKILARDVVKPLTRNCLELDLVAAGIGGGLGYLTCTRVVDEDFPWD